MCVSEGQQPVFEFPFAIEGDKIGNHTIKLSMLNKDSKWTKALKLMLANLKVCSGVDVGFVGLCSVCTRHALICLVGWQGWHVCLSTLWQMAARNITQ
jgi:hypothetical protein